MSCEHHRLSKAAPAPLLPAEGGFFRVEPKPVTHNTLKEAVGDLGGRTVGRQGWVIVVQRDGEVINLEHQPAGLPYADAEARAEALMQPDAVVVLGSAVQGNRKGTIYKHEGTITYEDTVGRLVSGIATLDTIVGLTGRSPYQKSASPVFPQDSHLEGLTAELLKRAKYTVNLGIEDLVELAAITDWRGLGDEALAETISEMAAQILASGEAFAKKINDPLLKAGMTVVKAVRRWDAAKYGWGENGKHVPPNGPIKATFDLSDKAAVNYLRSSTANFVTDQFRVRNAQFSEAARKIVARGFDQGLSSDDIGKDMARWLQLRGGDPSYYRVVAYAYTVRAEAYGHLSTYQKAGVEAAQFQAILDELTTDVCRWADGKLVRVGRALDLLKGLEKLENPQDVKRENPWVRTRAGEDGGKQLYVKGRDGETILADISRSGVGTKDDRGDYTDRVKDVLDAGIGPPPLHGLCRSTLVPVIV